MKKRSRSVAEAGEKATETLIDFVFAVKIGKGPEAGRKNVSTSMKASKPGTNFGWGFEQYHKNADQEGVRQMAIIAGRTAVKGFRAGVPLSGVKSFKSDADGERAVIGKLTDDEFQVMELLGVEALQDLVAFGVRRNRRKGRSTVKIRRLMGRRKQAIERLAEKRLKKAKKK
jgi:hypothetical protein